MLCYMPLFTAATAAARVAVVLKRQSICQKTLPMILNPIFSANECNQNDQKASPVFTQADNGRSVGSWLLACRFAKQFSKTIPASLRFGRMLIQTYAGLMIFRAILVCSAWVVFSRLRGI